MPAGGHGTTKTGVAIGKKGQSLIKEWARDPPRVFQVFSGNFGVWQPKPGHVLEKNTPGERLTGGRLLGERKIKRGTCCTGGGKRLQG